MRMYDNPRWLQDDDFDVAEFMLEYINNPLSSVRIAAGFQKLVDYGMLDMCGRTIRDTASRLMDEGAIGQPFEVDGRKYHLFTDKRIDLGRVVDDRTGLTLLTFSLSDIEAVDVEPITHAENSLILIQAMKRGKRYDEGFSYFG